MHLKKKSLTLVFSLLMGLSSSSSAKQLQAFIGTYTNTTSKGIYALSIDLDTGKLSEPTLAAEATNPSFLGFAPDLKTLYAINESAGVLRALAVGKDYSLRPLGDQPTGAGGPADVGVDPTGKFVVVAVYGGGATAGFPVKKDGALGERSAFVKHLGKSVHPKRQEAPHAHGVTFSKDGRFVIVPDLGLDQVKVYKVDAAAGQLTANTPEFLPIEPGSGPRHAAFSRDGKFLYTINELSSTVTVAAFDTKAGKLTTQQTIGTLPADFKGKSSTAEIAVHPNDRFVYGSNRGHDSIAVFSRNQKTGALTGIGTTLTGGKTPRHFALTPDGKWLVAANQDSDTLTVFKVDAKTGLLTATGMSVNVPRPVCVRFVSYP